MNRKRINLPDGAAAIRRAADTGNVQLGSGGYSVIKDSIGQYLIKSGGGASAHCIGLTGQRGTKYADKLNGTDFYYYE